MQIRFLRAHDGHAAGAVVGSYTADQARALITLGIAEEVTERTTQQTDAQQAPATQTGSTIITMTDEQFARLMNPEPTEQELARAADQVRTEGGQQDEQQRSLAPRVQRDERESAAFRAAQTLQLLDGIHRGQQSQIQNALDQLARGGHYGRAVAERAQRAAGDYYSTLVDADGGYLLPTAVMNEIEEVAALYGVARQLCTVFTHTTGSIKVPGASGALPVAFVAEGAAIASKIRAFQSVTLNPKKTAVIVPWTLEADLEIAMQILDDVNRVLARSFAKAEDDALFNGDGTSSYNSIDGILSSNRSSVAEYQFTTGNTSFDDITANDIYLMRRDIPAAARASASYVFHPDVEAKLLTLQDGQGRYIYGFNGDTGVATLGGRPVLYTEVLPAIGADAVDTAFGVFGDFSYFKMALGQGITTEALREAVVTDADTGSDINLATQDMRALKARELFDMDCTFENVFTKITTAAS